MIATSPRKVFINLPVQDLKRSVEFFTKLGFTFNAQFTDENATCMILSEEAYVMLLVKPYFKTFMTKEISDTSEHTEVLIALSCVSREEVDEMVQTALAMGGKPAMPSKDLGFMYNGSFYDLDGHHWEVMWMDPNFVMPQE